MILQQAISEKISTETVMFRGKTGFALSPSQASKQYPNVSRPFCLVTINQESIKGKAKDITFGMANKTFITDRNAVLSCFFDADKRLNAIPAEQVEKARFELIAALAGWRPAEDYYEVIYDGYAVREDNAGLAWVDFYFCFYQSIKYDCFRKSVEDEAALSFSFC